MNSILKIKIQILIKIKVFLILLVLETVLASCSSKHEQIEKENEKLFYNGTGKWEILSYEYTSKNQGTEQTKKYTNCGTFEFNENNEGKMFLEVDELLITKYRYGFDIPRRWKNKRKFAF